MTEENINPMTMSHIRLCWLAFTFFPLTWHFQRRSGRAAPTRLEPYRPAHLPAPGATLHLSYPPAAEVAAAVSPLRPAAKQLDTQKWPDTQCRPAQRAGNPGAPPLAAAGPAT